MADTSPPRPASGTDLTGRQLAGRYRLERLIASGGMAQVWEATDEILSRRVAVKLLHTHLAADDSFVRRFRAEAIAAAKLAHPAIVSIYDTCSDLDSEAIVMELVRGTTLRRLLDERSTLEPDEAVAIGAQVADALDMAHQAGLVHRDIKPANILLSDDGRVLVTDFGIAKAIAGADITQDGLMIGTAKYLAPEQVEGSAVDGRTDVFSLGVVLYEALCGRPPFTGDTDTSIALARLTRTPLRPRQVRAGIPRTLDDVIMRAIARYPDDRFATVGELRAALLSAGIEPDDDLVVTPGPTSEVVGYLGYQEPEAEPPPEREPSPTFTQSERRWLVPTLLIVLVAVSLGVAGVLFGQTEPGRDIIDRVTGQERGQEEAVTVQVTGASSFDPPPGDNGERNDLVGNVADGDPDTDWQTESYEEPIEQFSKRGVGVYVNVEPVTEVEELVVTSPSSGWDARIYATDQPVGADLASWGEPVDEKSDIDAGDTTFDLRGRRASAVMVWFTHLPEDGGDYRAKVSEMKVTN